MAGLKKMLWSDSFVFLVALSAIFIISIIISAPVPVAAQAQDQPREKEAGISPSSGPTIVDETLAPMPTAEPGAEKIDPAKIDQEKIDKEKKEKDFELQRERDMQCDLLMSQLSVKYELGKTYLDADKVDEALEVFQTIFKTELPPDLPDKARRQIVMDMFQVYKHAFKIMLERKGDKDGAMNLIKGAFARVETCDDGSAQFKLFRVELYRMQAEICKRQNDLQGAIDALKKADEVK
jgi:hypothetical protein